MTITYMEIRKHAGSLNSTELTVAIEAANAGGKVIRESWHLPPNDFQTKSDSHFDLVSIVDESADSLVQEILRSAFPEDKVLSEELNPEAVGFDPKQGRVWIIDPLDGTSAFLYKTDPFCPSVMIALLIDGVPTVSVVYQPVYEQWTYAVKGKGTYLDGCRNEIFHSLSKTVPHAVSLRESWIDFNHYGDIAYETKTFKNIENSIRIGGGARLVTRMPPSSNVAIRMLGNSSKRFLGACIHDHNPGKPKQMSWDIIPIKLIVEEAGGLYIDSHKGLEDPLDPFDLKGPIIVGHPKIVFEIITRLEALKAL